MRKRQFKKVLSLVLALAMVFTMNTSVFAAPDAEAPVEEAAAETTTPAAEAPAAEESAPPADNQETEAPADNQGENVPADKQEGEAPVDNQGEEAPADQVANPAADETTPASEGPKAEAQTEDAAGTAATGNGWTSSVEDATITFNEETDTFNFASGAPAANLTADTNPSSIKIAGEGTNTVTLLPSKKAVDVEIASDFAGAVTLGTDCFAIEDKGELGLGNALLENAALTAGKKYCVFKLADHVGLEEGDLIDYVNETIGYQGLTINGAWIDTSGTLDNSNIPAIAGTPSYNIAAVIPAYSGSEATVLVKAGTSFNEITVPKRPAAEPTYTFAQTATKIKIVEDVAATDEYRVMKEVEGDDQIIVPWTTGEGSPVNVVTTGYEKGTYYFEVRTKATSATEFAGETLTSSQLPVNQDSSVTTVSGFAFRNIKDSTISVAYDSDGIAQVSITGGAASVSYANANGVEKEPISINVAAGASLRFDGGDDAKVNDTEIDDTYANITLTGAGTVFVNALPTSAVVFPKAFDKVEGVAISGNSVPILISSNNAGTPKYTVVDDGEDVAATGLSGKLVAVTVAAETPAKTAGLLRSDNKLFDSAAGIALLSANGLEFEAIADKSVLVASNNRIEKKSVKFGEQIIYVATDAAATLNGAKYMNVPNKTKNEWGTRWFDSMVLDNGVNLYYDSDKNQRKKMADAQYEFIISTNESAKEKVAEFTHWKKVTDATTTRENGLVLVNGNSATETGNWAAKDGQTFSLYVRKIANEDEFKSDPEFVHSFQLRKKVTISLNLASSVSPNYYGDVNLVTAGTKRNKKIEELAARTDIVNRKFFNFTPHNFSGGITFVDGYVDEWMDSEGVTHRVTKDTYDDNKFSVLDGDGCYLGYVTINFGKYTNPTTITPLVGATNLYGLEVNSQATPYAAWVTFTPDTDDAQTIYNAQTAREDSGIVSFNVIKAPVKYEPEVETPQVSGATIIAPKLKATSQITGLTVFDQEGVVDYSSYMTASDVDRYYINGSLASSASWNALKAGSYNITVSSQGISSGKFEVVKGSRTDYSTTKVLQIVDANGGDGLKVSGVQLADKKVYYGTTMDGLKEALSANFTFAGIDVSGKQVKADVQATITVLNAPSANAAKAPESMKINSDKIKTVSAGSTVYAYYIDAPLKIGNETLKASSNEIAVKIEKRPVDISYKKGEDTFISSRRGEELVSEVSSDNIKLYAAEGNYGLTDPIEGTKFFVGKSIKLDLSMVNGNVPDDNYYAYLTGYTISSDYINNYQLGDDSINYRVKGRYYIKYILEYGGTGKDVKTGKRHVLSTVVDVDGLNGSVDYTFDPSNKAYDVANPPKGKIYISESFNGVLPAGNKITDWDVRDSYTQSQVFGNSFAYNDTTHAVTLTDTDYVVYAIVSAKATENGVMVKTIPPVNYYGMGHVAEKDGSTKKIGDLDVTLYDETRTETYPTISDGYNGYFTEIKDNGDGTSVFAYTLVPGTDYTLSYKNNVNASVAYDETVSGDETNYARIVTDAKMPQVVVKGKGDYKTLKTTVLFDILPTTIDSYGNTEKYKYQLAGKTLKTKTKVTKQLPKKNNPEYNVINNEDSKKTYTLKLGKAKKNGGYSGDYLTQVYKVNENGSRTLLTNFKKIAAGNYVIVYKGVNNYRGDHEEEVEVKEGTYLDQQKFKWTKKVNWTEKITTDSFKITVTNKKTKQPIPLVKVKDQATQAGYYISEIYNDSRSDKIVWVNGAKNVVDSTGLLNIDTSEYLMKNAGKYTITLQASDALMKATPAIVGSKELAVEVKGVKLKASDFLIETKKAGKTVVLDYDGKDTKAPVAVALAKPDKFPVDTNSKIPMAIGSILVKAADEETAEAIANNKGYNHATGNPNMGYSDDGAKLVATMKSNKHYTVGGAANNSSIYKTYTVTINPSGKYYGSEKDGTVKLSYIRGNIDIKKALTSGVIKVKETPAEVNIGGTMADLEISIAGMEGPYTIISGNTTYNYSKAYSSGKGKGLVIFRNPNTNDFEELLEISYSNNKKVGKGKATIKPTKYGKNFFKSSGKVDFTIKQRTVKEILSMNDVKIPNQIYAEINDTVQPKSGAVKTKVTLYQASDLNYPKLTKLGSKDYTYTIGTQDKTLGYPVIVTAGSSGNFKFENEKKESKLLAGYFNVYGKKAKIKVTLSDGNAPGVSYDGARKGYLYTGYQVDPAVTKIVIDGTTYEFPAGITTSSNFTVKYENDVKVGTATATITLKRDTTSKTTSGNNAYPFGGSVKVKYKIVPHVNSNLVLSK